MWLPAELHVDRFPADRRSSNDRWPMTAACRLLGRGRGFPWHPRAPFSARVRTASTVPSHRRCAAPSTDCVRIPRPGCQIGYRSSFRVGCPFSLSRLLANAVLPQPDADSKNTQRASVGAALVVTFVVAVDVATTFVALAEQQRSGSGLHIGGPFPEIRVTVQAPRTWKSAMPVARTVTSGRPSPHRRCRHSGRLRVRHCIRN